MIISKEIVRKRSKERKGKMERGEKYVGVTGGSLALTDTPSDVVTSNVPHGEGSDSKAKLVEHTVDLGRGGSLFDQESSLLSIGEEHTVAHKAITVSNNHDSLLDLLSDLLRQR